jgi:two-component system sensor histidine kinase RegB
MTYDGEMVAPLPVGLLAPAQFTRDIAPDLALPWVIRLRYGMVGGEAVIVLLMTYAFHLKLLVLWALAPLVIVLGSNILVNWMRPPSGRFSQQSLSAVFCLDTICLTIILGLTGGPMNPFSLLYLVQITLSAVVLRKIWAWALGVLATVCFGLLFAFHVPLAAFESHHMEPGLSPHLVGMWIAFSIAAILITFFTGKVSEALRRREQEVLSLHEQVAKNARLASLVTLAAGAAHELGTPLGTIAVVARELERYALKLTGSDVVVDDARLIKGEVERCRVILERMSAQGAEPMGETAREVTVSDLLGKVVDHFSVSQRTCLVLRPLDNNLAAVLPEHAVVQSLVALVQNAFDANIDERPVIISAEREGSRIRVSIQDHGCGMSKDTLQHIAEPFFTTKEPGKGMGLGTFLVRTFAERLGGRLLFESTPGQGTLTTLELPVNPLREVAYVTR